MTKRPFTFITEYYKDKIERDRKNNEFIFSQTDSLITWIIGFAITGLLLLIANIKSLDLLIRTPTKPIIICLLLTIVLGIAFRYVSFLVMMFEKGLDDYYFGLFSDSELTPFELDEEVENLTFEEILTLLKKDFDEDIRFPEPLTDEQKEQELPKLIQHYREWCDHMKKELSIAMNHIAEIEFTTHRIPQTKTMELFDRAIEKPKIGYRAVRWSLLRSSLFSLCLLSFLTAVFIVSFSLLFMHVAK